MPRSFAVAKRVRNETSIGRSAASVASVAVDLAQQVFGNLAEQPVLLIGAGKMAELCARHLREAGVRDFAVLNRTLSGRRISQPASERWLTPTARSKHSLARRRSSCALAVRRSPSFILT